MRTLPDHVRVLTIVSVLIVQLEPIFFSHTSTFVRLVLR